MTTALRFEGDLDRAAYAPQERVLFTLTARNDGAAIASIPDPRSGGCSLVLRLRFPSGHEEERSPADAPLPGTQPMLVQQEVLPGEPLTMLFELDELFTLAAPGRYVLVAEFAFADDEAPWRSRDLAFFLESPRASFLDVTPNEAAAIGYHGVVWCAPAADGSRALLFDCSARAPAIRGAVEIAALPALAEPALSTAPAGLPSPDRWLAWIADGALEARYLMAGDPAATLTAQPLLLPNGALRPRLIRPLLAEFAPDEERPRGAVGVLAENAAGGKDLLLVEIDRRGSPSIVAVVPMAGAVVAGWATAPSAADRVFVFALESPGWIHVIAATAPWDAACGAPVAWFVAAGDGFLGGDVRASLDGQVRVGLVLRRGSSWMRIAFTAPAPGERDATHIVTRALTPPDDAELVRVRLDGEGGVHLLYRRGDALFHVGPGSDAPTWFTPPHAQRAPAAAHLLLRPESAPLLVTYDADHGALLERI